MKTLKVISMLFLAIAFSWGIVSCGDDPVMENQPNNVVDTFSIVGVWECKSDAGSKVMSIDWWSDDDMRLSYLAIPTNEHIAFDWNYHIDYNDETGNVVLEDFDDRFGALYQRVFVDSVPKYLIPEDLKLPGGNFTMKKISNDKISIGSDVYCKQKPISLESIKDSKWQGYTFDNFYDYSFEDEEMYNTYSSYYQGRYDISFNLSADKVEILNRDNNMVHYVWPIKGEPRQSLSHFWTYGWYIREYNTDEAAEKEEKEIGNYLRSIRVDFLTSQFAYIDLECFSVSHKKSVRYGGLIFRQP